MDPVGNGSKVHHKGRFRVYFVELVQERNLWVIANVVANIELTVGLEIFPKDGLAAGESLKDSFPFLSVTGLHSDAREVLFQGCRPHLWKSNIENRQRQGPISFVEIGVAFFHDLVSEFSRSFGVWCQARWNRKTRHFVVVVLTYLFHIDCYGFEFGLVFLPVQNLLEDFQARERWFTPIAVFILQGDIEGVFVLFGHIDFTGGVVPHFVIMYFHLGRRY
mmetsp:Transcript_4662/g.11178  ORF Transcript_4662/g.11178 Transcript_4662/m.11178 type:complete len:220 (+) Transcript_4662:575-1234(+)